MRTTIWDSAVIALTTLIVATAFAVRDSSAIPAKIFWGVIAGALFCTFVRLVVSPLQREVESLGVKVAQLERRAGGPGTTAS